VTSGVFCISVGVGLFMIDLVFYRSSLVFLGCVC